MDDDTITAGDAGAHKARLLLIDGSGYIFRAFHALPMMTRADGTPVNAVYGFTSMLMKLVDDMAPDYVAVVFDTSRQTFRSDIYPDYKANRSAPPEELIPQFSLVREATTALSLPMMEAAGFEADDLIATYATMAEAANMETIIVSSDKDLMQLVRGDVTMLDPMKQRRIGVAEVEEKFGVAPDKVVDVQALAGDASDNVPGVPGIGIKTAAELINIYGDLDSLLERAGEIKQPKRRENLIEFAEQARISRQLVLLREDAPTPLDISAMKTAARNMDVLKAFLIEQNFNRLLVRIGASAEAGDSAPAPVVRSMGGTLSASAKQDNAAKDSGAATLHDAHSLRDIETNYTLITTRDALIDFLGKARKQGFLAVDTETTGLNASAVDLVGISMAIAPGQACYVPLRHGLANAMTTSDGGAVQGGLDFSDEGDSASYPQLDFEIAMAEIRPLFEDPAVLKIGHNLKYDAHVLMRPRNGGISLAPVDDTMCLSYVLDGGRVERHSMDYLAGHWFDYTTIKFSDLCGKGAKQIPFSDLSPDAALDYAAEDADITLRLWMILKPRLAGEKVASVYERLERPLIPVLAQMENYGITVDRSILARMSNDFATRMEALAKDILALAGEDFNIASPKQLGEILFDKMGLQGGKKAKTGAYSTSADILEDLAASGVEIASKVLDWRHLAKLKSTYADALVECILPETGRVHTSFSMVGASTGRLSSSDPNVQNIPIRTSEGRQIRTAFIAAEGCKLISVDYSQIELRLVAHVAGEHSMIEAFKDGIDIHARTASEVFGIPLDQMDSETRRRAKAINFGIIYGISAFGLARQLSIPQGEARDYIAAYFENFPGIRAYMERIKTEAREDGYVETLFGRRIHITGMVGGSPAHRGFAERQAINAPIQGSAADIIKRAMIRIPPALKTAGIKADMLLQVHDELIFESPAASADEAVKHITRIMEAAAMPIVNLMVPLVAEAGIADSWADAH
ncbi:DNA polymerase I [uncultured Candidatus Puniceispirillum sp.]|uniref:DNA polymerase I n=1 Tax=uncultured Candidatus Puniceispirillum sp. TaxID=1985115 RepID=UPI0032B29B97